MSLILDALKKSDRNRERGKVPDLQADHSSIVSPSPTLRRYRHWWLPLLLVLALGGGGLTWYVWPSSPPPVAIPDRQAISAPPVAPSPQPSSPPTTAPLEPAVTTAAPKIEGPVAVTTQKPARQAPAQDSGTERKPKPSQSSETEVYELETLPSHIRQGLPELTVSVHYYTPNPESRMVRINNRILREGEILPGGIKIAGIEKNGIICEMQGVRFRLPTTTLAVDRREESK